MSAFLRIDTCRACHRSLPWEWIPAVLLNNYTLAGTGVWRTQLVDGYCADCLAAVAAKQEKARRESTLRGQLIKLLGGEKPYREFTFERYRVEPENRLAYERAKALNPSVDNLYLWGVCGVGKTHLAYACARQSFLATRSAAILPVVQLSRKFRMKEPEEEQAVMNQLTSAEVLVLDDLGAGSNSAYTRQILQEILDGRTFRDRGGLVITSKYSLDTLAVAFGDDSIPSRLAGMCQIVLTGGSDQRLVHRRSDRQRL